MNELQTAVVDDPVNHPKHCMQRGVECIEVTRWMSFNLGNATKYIWRAGAKGDPVQDLEKAIFYLRDERERTANMLRIPRPAPDVDRHAIAGTFSEPLRQAFLLIWGVAFDGLGDRGLMHAVECVEAEIRQLERIASKYSFRRRPH